MMITAPITAKIQTVEMELFRPESNAMTKIMSTLMIVPTNVKILFVGMELCKPLVVKLRNVMLDKEMPIQLQGPVQIHAKSMSAVMVG